MTRKITAAILALALILPILATGAIAAGNPAGAAKFGDVKANDWFYPYVDALVKLGGIDGKTASTYDPRGNMTNAEFLKVVMASCGTVLPQGTDHWAGNYFAEALRLGVLLDGELPRDTWDKPITRQNMAKIIARASEILLGEAAVNQQEAEKLASANLDWAETCEACKPYIAQAMAKGILTGTYQQRPWVTIQALPFPVDAKEAVTGTKFNGGSYMTRAECSAAVLRLVDTAYRYQWYDGGAVQ